MQPISRRSRWSGALPSVSQENKNTTNLGFSMLQKAPFQALDFDIFLEEHDPGPL